MTINQNSQDRLFYKSIEVGFINGNGEVNDAKNKEGIEPIIEVFPIFLNNSLPEGERYDSFIRHISHENKTLVGVAKNLDELPGKLSINKLDDRLYVPFPNIPDNIVYAKTTLDSNMFFVNSELRLSHKPSFSGYQDKFTAKAEIIDGKLNISHINTEKEYGNVIVKPYNKKFFGITQNEFVCMKLANKVGLEVPKVFLIEHPDNRIPIKHLCVKRFDFTDTFPFEKKEMMEFTTLMGLNSKRKASVKTEEFFKHAEKCLDKSELEKLGKTYFFGLLICNGDMHLKNFSVFIMNNKTYQLTPIYDMVNIHVYGDKDILALPMTESFNPSPHISIITDFLAQYIIKEDMYKMIETVENNLIDILNLAYPNEEERKPIIDARNHFCRYPEREEMGSCTYDSLKNSILTRVAEVKGTLDNRIKV